jgi:hypothetical protein
VAEAVVVLAEHGLDADLDLCSRHFKVRRTAHGRRRLLIISKTPSDRHAAVLSRAQLKRLLRADALARASTEGSC